MQMKSYLNKPIQTFVQRTLFGDQANTPPKKKMIPALMLLKGIEQYTLL